MALNKMKIYWVLLLMVFLLGCKDRPGQKEYLEITKIPRSDDSGRLAKFSAYPIEKQIDIYLYPQRYEEGGSVAFLYYLGDEGKNKIPHIAKRIDESSNWLDKVYLINVLEFIDLNCQCVADDADSLALLIKNEEAVKPEDGKAISSSKELYSKQVHRIRDRDK